MEQLQVITIENNVKWDKLVKSFRDYDVYYLSGYSRAFQIHGDGEPVLFYYEDDNIRGMNVVMLRDIANDKNFVGKLTTGVHYDIVTPYGYGGWLIEGDTCTANLSRMDAEYSAYCRDKGIVSEFVRFHPLLKNGDRLGNIYSISPLGQTISMVLDSREVVWNNLTSKNRNMVRKALKSGVEIFWGRNPELFREFITIYNSTMRALEADEYYYFDEGFYNSILNDLRYNAMVFYAKYKGQTIAMSIVLSANQKMHYHLSASVPEFQHLAPTNLLLFEAACWGSENGYKVFHLGGGLGSGEDSLYKFKSSFNKKSDCQFVVGKKIFKQDVYDQLIKMRMEDTGARPVSGFFPVYRAVFDE